jgi:coproporphyrinogen III oxidase-like Fe-S oxidoreductase
MYLHLIERFTQAGYTHYEIASLARQPSRHNQVYWHNQPYYGLGVGATGYVFNERITRPRRLVDYFSWVEAGIFTRDTPLSLLEELGETLMLGLRLVEGVDLAGLIARFGEQAVHTKLAALRRMSQQGLVEEQAGRLKLVYPKGFLLANEVLQEVI